MVTPFTCELQILQPFTWAPPLLTPSPSSSNFFLPIALLENAYKKLNV